MLTVFFGDMEDVVYNTSVYFKSVSRLLGAGGWFEALFNVGCAR